MQADLGLARLVIKDEASIGDRTDGLERLQTMSSGTVNSERRAWMSCSSFASYGRLPASVSVSVAVLKCRADEDRAGDTLGWLDRQRIRSTHQPTGIHGCIVR